MAFLLDEESFATARAVVEAKGYPSAAVQQGGLEMLAGMLEENAPPKLLLLDLDREENVLDAARRAISLCGPGCRIIFTATQNDITVYRRLKQIGAADYLVKPLSVELLRDAMTQALQAPAEALAAKTEGRAGKIVAVIGARGGVGTTTLAVNLAYGAAHILNQHVAVLDLDVHFGTTALSVDKEPGRGMRAALENPERLDSLLVASSMVQESEHLSILCAEEAIDTPLHFDGEAALALIKPVAGNFDFVFVDVPRFMLGAQKRLLGQAHAIVLVTDLSLAGLRDARRIRQYIKNLRPDLLPLVVANRVGESANSTLDIATFEKSLEAKFDLRLPEDAKTAIAAANTGKSLLEVAPKAEVSQRILELARMITGIAEEKKAEDGRGHGILKGLLGAMHHHDADHHGKPAPKPA